MYPAPLLLYILQADAIQGGILAIMVILVFLGRLDLFGLDLEALCRQLWRVLGWVLKERRLAVRTAEEDLLTAC